MDPNLPFRYGAAYSSAALIGAGGSVAVFTAAANANGAIVWSVVGLTKSATVSTLSLLANTAAPASSVDGDGIWLANMTTVNVPSPPIYLPRPVFIAAGKGLFFFSTQLETGAWRSVLYTLL